MSKESSHREILLKSACKLVLEKGLSATRVDEICAEAQVTKGSFYHHFESKEHLAAELLDDFYRRLAAAMQQGGWQELDTAEARLAGLMDRALEMTKEPILQRGCIMGVMTVDLEKGGSALLNDVGHRFDSFVRMVAEVVEQAMREKGAGPDVAKQQATMLAKQFVAVLEGSLLMTKATGDRMQLTQAVQTFRVMAMQLLAGLSASVQMGQQNE